MKIEYFQIAYAVVIKFWSVVCNVYRYIGVSDYVSPLALWVKLWPGRALTAGRPASLACVHFASSIKNTFTFESDEFRVLYRFVGRNRYRLVADAVFRNRLTGGVFSSGNLPTMCFLKCRLGSYICAPDSVLSFLLQNRCFVGFVGKKQIMLSGGFNNAF
jgi:hypothetical protein